MSQKNTPVIDKQLKSFDLEEGKDYFLHDEFCDVIFPVISVYFYNKTFVSLAQITLTERCTLKCRKCAHGCYAVNNKTARDMTLEQVYRSADSFFSKVDFIKEFVLIGGEPLLYRELAKVIPYIGEKYRESDSSGLYADIVYTESKTVVQKNVSTKLQRKSGQTQEKEVKDCT